MKIGEAQEIYREQVRVYDNNGKFYGIYAFQVMTGNFKPVKMFLER